MAGKAAPGLGRWGAIAALAVLASCAPSPAPEQPPIAPPPAVRAVALDPESYMAFSASAALFAVQASRMAEARGSTSRIRKVAAQLGMDQSGIGAQLNFAGRRIDLLPSSKPLAEHQAMLHALATSTSFDATYKAQLTKILRDAAAVHRAFEANGASPTLRPVASFAAPVCEKNLAAIGKL